MFKKRLKGLLAMVLAGSIATTAMPLSASATISGDISVVDGGIVVDTVDKDDIVTDLNFSYSGYLKTNNLWAIYSVESGGEPVGYKTCAGNEIVAEMQNYKENPPYEDYLHIRYNHDILFTTKDITNGETVTIEQMDNTVEATVFPCDIPVNPLKELTSWTAWYNRSSGDEYTNENCTKSSTYVDQTSTQISADVIKELYQGDNSDAITYGKTIIELKTAFKTLEIPVKNALGDTEGNDKKVSITYNSTGDIDGYLEGFYLCYIDSTNGIFKISNNAMSTKTALWTEIDNFAKDNTITGFNPNNLSLRRSVTMNVNSKSQYEGEFTTKDLFEYKHVNNNTTENPGLKYLYVDAHAESIWRVAYSDKWYFADKVHIDDAIRACLKENPKANLIYFTEQTTINVTGTTPTEGGEISTDKIIPPQILKDNGSPKTISELLAELAASKSPASGKKYDLNGWQLWSATPGSGVLRDFHKIEFNTSGVTGVSAEMFNEAGSYNYPVIYFPQVDAPSSGGSSGGSSSRPEPSYDPNKPTIDGEEKDWDDVAKDIGKFSEGETKTITLGRDKTIPADVIKAIKDSKAVITFKINSAFSWTVDGSTLTDGDIHDYDFSIEVITAAGVEILRGDVGVGFKIGDISDGATLNINFKIEHAQEFANLYKMVDGELVFVDNVKIDENGAAIGLEVTEAGDYVVMLGKMSDRPGDMDNDGIMNAKDSLAILKDFLGMESGANPLVSDMNGDSFINAKDALIIVKKSVGIE